MAIISRSLALVVLAIGVVEHLSARLRRAQVDEYYRVLAQQAWLESKVSEGGTSLERVREQQQLADGIGAGPLALLRIPRGDGRGAQSSLLRALSGQHEIVVEDRLFATLDPTTRRLALPGGEREMEGPFEAADRHVRDAAVAFVGGLSTAFGYADAAVDASVDTQNRP